MTNFIKRTKAWPTSAILAETFIQHLEHIKIIKILNKHQIVDYYRYTDNILITYNTNTTNVENTLNEFNSIHPKIKFKKAAHNTLNYLDLTIRNSHNKLTFGIYRKPTNTDLIIHNDSCNPNEHNKSATAYLTNHMITNPITHENKVLGLNTINEILVNNHYRQHITNTTQNQHNSPTNPQKTMKEKWATFTYYGPEARMTTKSIKNTDIGIAFKTTNTIKKTIYNQRNK
jgi:hypothetical protein